MTTKVLKLKLADIPTKDAAGAPISDPIGTRITQAYADPSMKDFALSAAYETPHGNPTHLMLYFQKP